MADDLLKDAKEAFKLASDAEQEQRQISLDDLRFAKLGEQWPEKVKTQRELEGRPCLTLNRMPSFIKQVTNDARQNRPSIKCHPVGDGADKETAEILDGLVRNIEYTSNADVAYDTALDFSVTCGIGYFVIRTDYTSDDSFDQDIQIERVANPFSIYGDPHSTGADSADWNTAFITDLMRKSEFERRWPGADKSDWEGRGFDSKDTLWFQGDSILVAEYWKRDEVPVELLKLSNGAIMLSPEFEKVKDLLNADPLNPVTVEGTRKTKTHKVTQYIMNGSEILETNAWAGKYIPIVPVYGDEVNIEGKRYFQSLIRFAKDSQRQYNFWRTATTELVALAPKTPYIGLVGQFDTDAQKWANANNVSYPYIEYDQVQGAMGPPQRQQFAGPPAGALQEALNASDDMKNIMGIHDASLGARSNETSGRAIMARQREGDISTFNFIDNLSRGIKHGGRILIDLIPKVYNVERIARCIKEDGSSYSMPINQPAIPQEVAAQLQQPPMQPQGMQPGMPPMQPGMPPQQPQQPPQGPQQGQQPTGQQQYVPVPQGLPPEQLAEIQGLIKVFDLTAGKYDVTVQAGPSFTTRREESATQMMEFIRVLPSAAGVMGDLLAKNLDWPGADEIAGRLKAMLPPQAAGQNPQLQQAEQAVQQLQQQVGQMQQQLQDKGMDFQIKQQELQIKGAELQLKAQELQKPEAQPGPGQLDVAELGIKQREVVVKEYQAETDRIKVLIDAGINPLTGQLLVQTVAQAGNTPIDGKPTEPQEPEMPMHQMPDGSMMAGPPMDEPMGDEMGGMQGGMPMQGPPMMPPGDAQPEQPMM
jgi:hypothetical protein